MAHKLLTCILTIALSLGVLGGLSLNPAPAQAAPPKTSAQAPPAGQQLFSPDHRREIYEAQKLSYTDALLWQLLFPGLGNIYAKQYFHAGLSFVLMGFATVFAAYAFRTDQTQFYWWSAGSAGVAYVGGGTLALFGVSDYNRELREGLKVPDEQASGADARPFGLALTLRF